MKKTILAMAVPALLAAGSASASINLYDAEGVKVDASGAAEVQYFQAIGENKDGEWRLDDGDFAVNTEVAVSEDLAAIGHFAFKFEDSTTKNDELYVGFKGSDWGTLTFGRQLLINDDMGITKDYELSSASNGTLRTEGDQVAKYVYDNGTFYAGLSTLQNSDGEESTDEYKIYDGRLGYRVADVDMRVYYYYADDAGVNGDGDDFVYASKGDVENYNFEVEYAGIENVSLAAAYGVNTVDTGSSDEEADFFSVAADYTHGKTTYAIGVDNKDVDSGDDVTGYYANVTYALHNNAKVYAEVGDNDADNNDWGYVAGMEVKF
ncbi:porin [Salinivibrio kushneri]|uniref:Porin n=1 Tax=Salinivibrio kushneri TaxID=1908198 RepID=A0AA47KMA6_9GAMM|nr:porin [Salinivibrio kushneri]WBA09448.1 porin [Salinivibrio kushneri]